MVKPADEGQNAATLYQQDLPALEQLFKECYAMLLAYAGKFVVRETAEDIVQDVFVQLHKKSASLHIATNIKSYLFRCIHNSCLDYIRHQAVHQRYVNAALPDLTLGELDYYNPDGPHQSLLQQNDLESSVWQAIEALPPKCREVVKLRYRQGLKTTEISEVMGISSRTVETQLYKAIKQLRGIVRRVNYLLCSIL
ncbi:RNA polymerase sigma-70 factor (ECF subfamily) [Chitinophaga niastensis]|uniref:RNA polymerase sigma-70 factor (ECF subfamily) n=1 Tax=Chitinophaga niastensis TaxID=536980 RepID=A0A2P8HDI8_CHINA|nr:RNA polymerase sigma-70 factor [Chitinophaga niastensis]PSL44191.1 RNA polymerase sigma-70 factor (ECF subfamily) [Chitinophaga niastensis]